MSLRQINRDVSSEIYSVLVDNQKRLTHYVTNTNFNQQIESLQMDIKNIIEKIATASDDLKTMKTYSEIFNSKLKSKIEMPDVKKEVDMIWNQFSKFCSYEHIQKIERKNWSIYWNCFKQSKWVWKRQYQ